MVVEDLEMIYQRIQLLLGPLDALALERVYVSFYSYVHVMS